MSVNAQPNVIYILGDDQRADYLGCAGHPMLETPQIDQLAREGTYFPNAFCTSPLCTPSRACHYLGQWERKHGINFNSGMAVSPRAWARSFPQLLRQAGYFTGWIGKNHVPVGDNGYGSTYFQDSFDYWYGNHGHSTFYPKELGKKGEIYQNASVDTQPEIFMEGALNFLSPDDDFISRCSHPLPRRPVDSPFCMCLTFNLPHGASTSTMQLRPEDDELYKSAYRDRMDDMPVPPSFRNWAGEPKIPRHVWNGIWIPSYDYVKTLPTLRERQVRTCQTITGVDRVLGRLRTELDALGIADNTIIVFSTDHGLHHGEHGLGGKVFMYEEDLRIPMIVMDPRVDAASRGQRREELVLVEDLAPTILDLCGLGREPAMQGRSLASILAGAAPLWRDAFFAENLFDAQNYPRCEAVRTADWKYIRYFGRTEDASTADRMIRNALECYHDCRTSSLTGERPVYEELYHLSLDPHEERNEIGNPSFANVLETLRRRIDQLGTEALDGADTTDTVYGGASVWVSQATRVRVEAARLQA